MKIKEKKEKIKINSDKGFTVTDLVIAIVCFTTFVGVIGGLFYTVYKINLQTKMTGTALNYAIEILEDIDKITYEEVVNGMEDDYITKFSIPKGYQIELNVENYNSGTDKDNLIKKVKLTISYSLSNESETIVMQKLKIREI